MKKLFLIVFFSLLLLPFASAGFGYNIYPERAATTNFTLVNVNNSNFWDNLDSPLASWLSTYNLTYDLKNSSKWDRVGTYLSPKSAGDKVIADGGLIIGTGETDIDYNFTFNGETNNGTVIWMEDEDYFEFMDSIFLNTDRRLYFNDIGVNLYSIGDGGLTINTGTKVSITGGLDVSGETNLARDTIIEGDLDVAGDLNVTGTTNLSGDTIIEGDLNVAGETTFKDDVLLADGKKLYFGASGNFTPGTEYISSTADGWTDFRSAIGYRYYIGASDILSLGAGGVTMRGIVTTNGYHVTRDPSRAYYLLQRVSGFQGGITGDFVTDELKFGLSNDLGMQFIINDQAHFVKDFDHAIQTNPTLYIQSATNPDTNNTQWLSLTHNQTDGIIDVGSGDIVLKDNTIIEGDLDVTKNFTGNQIYAEVWYHNHTATSLTFGTDGLFYNLTLDNSDLNGFTFNDAEDSITPLVDGKYKVSWMASGDGANNEEYYTTILVNGADYDRCEAHKKMTAGGDIVTMTGNCFVDLVTTDYVQLGTANIGGTSTGNYYSATLNLVRIGD